LPNNFKIEPSPKNIGLQVCAKTKEPSVQRQEKIEENKKVSCSSLHSKTIQSKLHSYGEDGEIWEEKVLSKD
jgi:hypothetical protein